MKIVFVFFGLIILFSCSTNGQAFKVISDCTVTYEVSVRDSKADAEMTKMMSGSTKVLYIKGSKSRNDLITPGFRQTTLTDSKSDTAVILKELGNTKYLSYLYGSRRKEQNKKYEGMQFKNTDEKKNILGYDCRKAIAKLTDGSTYDVYYTLSIAPINKEYEYQFKDLPGFVLEYEAESTDGKAKIKYSATKVTLSLVPDAVFDIPKNGYRIL